MDGTVAEKAGSAVDHLVRVVSRDGSLRGVAAATGVLVEEVRRRQRTDPTATVALGRLLSGAALFGALLKEDQRLLLTIEGSGPIGRMQAEADAHGEVRGSIKNPLSGLAPTADGFDVAAAIGRAGFLHVVKDLGLREPYRGTVQLYRSTVAEDLAYYLTVSEQIPSCVALGVYVEADGCVATAGGFLLQALPGGDPGRLALLEERLAALPAVSALLRSGATPLGILERILDGIPFQVKAEYPVRFRCSCSRRRALEAILALGEAELTALLARAETPQVTCEFCKEVYAFAGAELSALRAKAGRGA